MQLFLKGLGYEHCYENIKVVDLVQYEKLIDGSTSIAAYIASSANVDTNLFSMTYPYDFPEWFFQQMKPANVIPMNNILKIFTYQVWLLLTLSLACLAFALVLTTKVETKQGLLKVWHESIFHDCNSPFFSTILIFGHCWLCLLLYWWRKTMSISTSNLQVRWDSCQEWCWDSCQTCYPSFSHAFLAVCWGQL